MSPTRIRSVYELLRMICDDRAITVPQLDHAELVRVSDKAHWVSTAALTLAGACDREARLREHGSTS